MTTKQRTAATKFDDIPGELPQGAVPDGADLAQVSKDALEKLNSLQKENLTSNVIWRDLLALTDTFRTFYSANTIFETLQKLSHQRNRSRFRASDAAPRVAPGHGCSWIDVDILFSIQESNLVGQCAGTVSILKAPDGNWKIWMLRTWLEYWDGHGNPDHPVTIENSTKSSPLPNGHDEVYDAIIAGAGQCGLGVSGRLQALGVRYVLFEALPSVGDIWANRYDSLKWHTIRDFGNLPFGYTYSLEDDQMVPAKRIGSGHKAWAEKYGLNVQTSTKVESAKWDDDAQLWNVTTSCSGVNSSWRTKNLILSLGTGHATPVSPEWASPDRVDASGFQGTIVHASKYRNSKPWAGKRGIVIGTANTAHDIAEDMANVGMDTTMVQRGATFIFPVEWLIASEEHDYNRDKPTAIADRETFTYPYKILREMVNGAVVRGVDSNPERFDSLERVGFKLDRYGDLLTNLLVRFGGHYVDIGASKRIVKGEIKMKTQPVRQLTQNGLAFEDGTELPADLIVVATGFDHNFRNDAARIVGHEVADQMDDFWGVGPEGELRGHARLAGHPHLYYFGGDGRTGRFISRFLALQVQKELLGLPLRPYMN